MVKQALNLGLLALASGCAGTVTLNDTYSGTCDSEHARCLKDRCADLRDTRDCSLACDFEARICQRDQKGEVAAGRRLSEDKALLVDLMGDKIRWSSAVTVTTGGEIRPWKDSRALQPGAFLKIDFQLPADVRFGELHLLHAPGGEGVGCFITMTVNEKPLVGRYAPPRTQQGALRRETWDLARFLEVGSKTPQTVSLFVFNNNTAGSQVPYLLGGIELYYKAMEEQAPPAAE
ncbi:MAG: hypothetical protein KC613_04290 [Myxococcales bacterium]|nr:hypothetical protein [Myxococcales bacterium]MCB9521818.1 hypothetical protein [Myxococcales bacterium]